MMIWNRYQSTFMPTNCRIYVLRNKY